jgi:hypothetical protein
MKDPSRARLARPRCTRYIFPAGCLRTRSHFIEVNPTHHPAEFACFQCQKSSIIVAPERSAPYSVSGWGRRQFTRLRGWPSNFFAGIAARQRASARSRVRKKHGRSRNCGAWSQRPKHGHRESPLHCVRSRSALDVARSSHAPFKWQLMSAHTRTSAREAAGGSADRSWPL